MTLKDYLALPGKTATDIAKTANVSVSTITRAAKGSIPSAELMRVIFEETEGAVTPNDFFGVAA